MPCITTRCPVKRENRRRRRQVLRELEDFARTAPLKTQDAVRLTFGTLRVLAHTCNRPDKSGAWKERHFSSVLQNWQAGLGA
jgi:hypothetical protein